VPSLVRFKDKDQFCYFENGLVYYNAGVVARCKFRSRRIGSWDQYDHNFWEFYQNDRILDQRSPYVYLGKFFPNDEISPNLVTLPGVNVNLTIFGGLPFLPTPSYPNKQQRQIVKYFCQIVSPFWSHNFRKGYNIDPWGWKKYCWCIWEVILRIGKPFFKAESRAILSAHS
jgi:hypothetical protein